MRSATVDGAPPSLVATCNGSRSPRSSVLHPATAVWASKWSNSSELMSPPRESTARHS